MEAPKKMLFCQVTVRLALCHSCIKEGFTFNALQYLQWRYSRNYSTCFVRGGRALYTYIFPQPLWTDFAKSFIYHEIVGSLQHNAGGSFRAMSHSKRPRDWRGKRGSSTLGSLLMFTFWYQQHFWSDTLRQHVSTAELHPQRCHYFQVWAPC